MDRIIKKLISALFVPVLMVVCADAIAQAYFVRYSALGVGSCSATNIQGTIFGEVSLPPPPDNVIVNIAINGVPAGTSFFSFDPPVQAPGLYPFSYNIPNTPMPYTITGDAYPSLNGVAVGIGISVSYHCTNGVLTIDTPQLRNTMIPAAPTLTQWGMILLAGLLALFGLARIRRHKGS